MYLQAVEIRDWHHVILEKEPGIRFAVKSNVYGSEDFGGLRTMMQGKIEIPDGK